MKRAIDIENVSNALKAPEARPSRVSCRLYCIGYILGIFLLASCARREASPSTFSPDSAGDIDDSLQKAATDALGDREGAVIVIDPNTGRLHAVVNPRLAFEQAFPPGSSIKPFTALSAMRAGLVDRATVHLCRTRYERGGFTIDCTHPRSASPFDLPHALAYSCNDYFARVGERLSEGTFNATLNRFGFGARTGVSANEAAGILPRGEWHVATALGESEGLLVTPVQLMAAYTALVNGGRLYRPQIGNKRDVIPSAQLNIIPKHRSALIEGMRGAVRYGTAGTAGLGRLPSYVFGKTGTSTSSNGFRTQGWFVGFLAEADSAEVPREDQIRLGVLVFLKRAHGSQCAEVAGKIFDYGLRIDGSGENEGETRKRGDEIDSPGRPVGRPATPPATPPATTPSPSFAIHQPQTISVRSISEKLTRELPLEEYLIGVLEAESGIEVEPEALKAQAVISRTFALRNTGRHEREGYDFCSTTHCQRFVYSKKQSNSSRSRVVAETAGEVLHDGMGQLVDAYFHAACGGVTANIRALWGVPAPSYLRGVRDDFCATMPHYRWTQTVPAAQLVKALQSDVRTDIGPKISDILVRKRDATGRAELLALEGARRRIVSGWDFKIIVGRSLGWQMIKSSRFDVSRSGGDFVFRGSGFGHGLGLCQEGAHVMASRGMNYRQILQHYFPGTRGMRDMRSKRSMRDAMKISVSFPGGLDSRGSVSIDRKSETGSWRLISSENFRASFSREADRRSVENVLQLLETARTDLLRRLQRASVQLPEPKPFEVVIHANTADFITATGQSGLAAGATRGRRIELQPLTLLRRRGILDTTLRHELAHAVIEILSDGRAPRWLSEGLAIHVAGEGAAMLRIAVKGRLTREELERKLSRPAPAKVMRELYAEAYRQVVAMIRSEGENIVWRLVAKERDSSMV